jgi:hypothetical protein
MMVIFLGLLLASPSPLDAPRKPHVDVEVIGQGRLLIRSHDPIETVNLAELTEWCSYFICYSPDCRKVTVLIRTRQTPLHFAVETRSPLDFGVRRKHELLLRNPWTFSQE